MPFVRPTLPALRDLARQGIAARLPDADPALRRSVLGVLADAFAGLVYQQYGYLDWQVRQLIPATAEDEYLERWASIVGLSRKAAEPARGEVAFAGTNGVVIPSGTRLLRTDGVAYRTTAPATIASGTATAPVEAEAGGAEGDVGAGALLAMGTAIPGVLGTATVGEDGLSGGSPVESDLDLRGRLRARLATPPQGGAASDYVAWALEVPGVTRAWAYPNSSGAGTVGVAFTMDGRVDPIPEAADVAAVQAHIDPLRPVTAQPIVFAPTAVPLAVSITGLVTDTTAVRAAIVAELGRQIAADAAPGGTIRRSRISEAISRATGEEYHTLVAPAADVTHGFGEIAVLGTVTFA